MVWLKIDRGSNAVISLVWSGVSNWFLFSWILFFFFFFFLGEGGGFLFALFVELVCFSFILRSFLLDPCICLLVDVVLGCFSSKTAPQPLTPHPYVQYLQLLNWSCRYVISLTEDVLNTFRVALCYHFALTSTCQIRDGGVSWSDTGCTSALELWRVQSSIIMTLGQGKLWFDWRQTVSKAVISLVWSAVSTWFFFFLFFLFLLLRGVGGFLIALFVEPVIVSFILCCFLLDPCICLLVDVLGCCFSSKTEPTTPHPPHPYVK